MEEWSLQIESNSHGTSKNSTGRKEKGLLTSSKREFDKDIVTQIERIVLLSAALLVFLLPCSSCCESQSGQKKSSRAAAGNRNWEQRKRWWVSKSKNGLSDCWILQDIWERCLCPRRSSSLSPAILLSPTPHPSLLPDGEGFILVALCLANSKSSCWRIVLLDLSRNGSHDGQSPDFREQQHWLWTNNNPNLGW